MIEEVLRMMLMGDHIIDDEYDGNKCDDNNDEIIVYYLKVKE